MKNQKIKYETENGIFYIENGTVHVDNDTIKDTAQLFKDIQAALKEYHDNHSLLEKRNFNIKSLLDE